MLQRLTEDLEYSDLLDRAARCESSLEQMCLVAAFSVSSYSTTIHRTGKPFNPLLGETYELDRLEEYGYRSICEQVSFGDLSVIVEFPIRCVVNVMLTLVRWISLTDKSPPPGGGPSCDITAWLDPVAGDYHRQQVSWQIHLYNAAR